MEKDIQKSNNMGCYYFQTFYPSDLFLTDKENFWFEHESKKYLVLIHTHLKSLVINDYGNKLIKKEENGHIKHYVEKNEIKISKENLSIEIENDAYYIIDYEKHLHKELYTISHTEIILCFESLSTENNFELAHQALLYFIDAYKIVSGDVLTLVQDKIPFFSKIYKNYFHQYSKEELLMNSEDRMKLPRGLALSFHKFTIPFWNMQGKKITEEPKEISRMLKEYFIEKKKVNPLAEYILKSMEELHVHKNYKYSLIESWTALEIAVVSYLAKLKLGKGISKTKIDDYEGQVGISYLINIELPLVCKNNDQDFKDLILKVDNIRKIRNKVIHENKSVSEFDADTAIKTLGAFLDYTGYRKY